jgi:hypothetical protein
MSIATYESNSGREAALRGKQYNQYMEYTSCAY